MVSAIEKGRLYLYKYDRLTYLPIWVLQIILTFIGFRILDAIHVAADQIYFELQLEIVLRIILIACSLLLFAALLYNKTILKVEPEFIGISIVSLASTFWIYFLLIETYYGL